MHLMTPHAAKSSVLRSKTLADAMIRSAEGEEVISVLGKEVNAFENEMMTRAAKVQKHSLAITKRYYSTPEHLMRRLIIG